MILKEKTFKQQTDLLLKAGDEAEKQMAFHLKREFGKGKDIFVINDLRIVHDGEAAQLDHLLVTRYGLFIVESKSVHGTVAFNQHGDWVRTYQGDRQGMPSPIKQAEAQGKIVKNLMRDNTEKLLDTLLGMQKGFRYCPIEIRVAISDSGIIERGYDEPKVLKADMVSESISQQLKELKSVSSLLSLKLDAGWVMKQEEARRVADFLVACHQPRIGDICPKCQKHLLVRGSNKRGDGTERNYLRCADYPQVCKKGVFPLDAMSISVNGADEAALDVAIPHGKIPSVESPRFKADGACPECKTGKLVKRNGRYGKPDFLGCSNFGKTPSCGYMATLDGIPHKK